MVNKKFKLNSYLIDIYFTINGNDDSLFDSITETIIKYKSITDEHSIFISDSAHINDLEDKNNFIKNISILHYKVLVNISEFDNLRISLINLLKKYNYIYGINLYHNELPASLDIIDGVYQEIYPSKSYHKDTVYVKFTDEHKNHISLSQSDISSTEESEHICRINDLILSDPHPDPNVIRLKKMTNIVLYFRSEIENVKFSSSQMIGKIIDILNSYGLNINGNTFSVCIGHNKNCSNIVPIYIIMKHQTNYTQDFFNDVINNLYNIDISLIGLTVSSDDYSDFLINNDIAVDEENLIISDLKNQNKYLDKFKKRLNVTDNSNKDADKKYDLSLYLYVRSGIKLHDENIDHSVHDSFKNEVTTQLKYLLDKYTYINDTSDICELTIANDKNTDLIDNVLGLSIMINVDLEYTEIFLQSIINSAINMGSNIVGVIIKKLNSKTAIVRCTDNTSDDERQMLMRKWNSL